MRLPRMRLTLRASLVIVALLAAILGLVIVPLNRAIERWTRQREYEQAAGGITRAILSLENRVPQAVPPTRWKSAVRLIVAAHFNAFRLWKPPPLEEAYRMSEELRLKLSGPVDVRTLEWIWNRVALTGADGKDYTDKYRPSFRKALRQISAATRPEGVRMEGVDINVGPTNVRPVLPRERQPGDTEGGWVL